MKTLKLSLIALAGLFIYSCASEYPKLEDGLYAEFETSEGDFVTELYYQKTPMTVGNFVALAEGNHPKADEQFQNEKFYDSLIFHRIIDGFMIQGGDPQGTGQGGPGYSFPDEFHPDLKHEKGVLSMANAGPGTNGSQFFITLVPTPHLDGRHSVFGKVVVGEAVVDSIGKVETKKPGDRPVEDVVIETVNIIRKGSEAKAFDAVEAFKEGVKNAEEAKKEALALLEKKLEEASEGFEVTDSGLRYNITTENPGGVSPEAGDMVKVHYSGYLLDGTKFDSSLDRDEPIEFAVGTGRVIPGWDEGIMLLKTGEKAELVIPAELAYGARQVGPIPANSILKFEVELLEVDK
ncbi:peptidylprolyl isomerase [Psychroflexus sp. YR1-1]|uniref:peptidylprolyl isomerase n=1 Tax=Psychroflexus aurantiacus TaxID=2709310 RepID=A0A6B3R250_9FLAO|nr:peptidylprolyl isomerase [Psychroflexus aurantiacus]NEV93137.1 peptidylprolyl isomerase [Psychroflexus aurantiacus]